MTQTESDELHSTRSRNAEVDLHHAVVNKPRSTPKRRKRRHSGTKRSQSKKKAAVRGSRRVPSRAAKKTASYADVENSDGDEDEDENCDSDSDSDGTPTSSASGSAGRPRQAWKSRELGQGSGAIDNDSSTVKELDMIHEQPDETASGGSDEMDSDSEQTTSTAAAKHTQKNPTTSKAAHSNQKRSENRKSKENSRSEPKKERGGSSRRRSTRRSALSMSQRSYEEEASDIDEAACEDQSDEDSFSFTNDEVVLEEGRSPAKSVKQKIAQDVDVDSNSPSAMRAGRMSRKRHSNTSFPKKTGRKDRHATKHMDDLTIGQENKRARRRA